MYDTIDPLGRQSSVGRKSRRTYNFKILDFFYIERYWTPKDVEVT